jgi:nucleotide-binding universal stress UspA family protein
MFKRIVVGTDGSASAGIAVDTAIDLAKLSGATLHVVSAYKSSVGTQFAAGTELGIPVQDIVEVNEMKQTAAQACCDEAVERAEVAGVSTRTHSLAGDAAEAILQVAEQAECDLLVVGNRGMSGVRRFMLGNVPNKLSHHSPASLLIVDTSAARQ